VFGLSFGELVVVVIVAMVVLGPKELPKVLRTVGQWAGRARRFAAEMREKSGIDDVLRVEGIDRDIAEIRKLARGEIEGVVAAGRSVRAAVAGATAPVIATPSATGPTVYGSASELAATSAPTPALPPVEVDRVREYPLEGPDSYGALPDTAMVYGGGFPASPLASDPIYTGASTSSSTPAAPRDLP
jgi:sec-independent protein translocase protein TatB